MFCSIRGYVSVFLCVYIWIILHGCGVENRGADNFPFVSVLLLSFYEVYLWHILWSVSCVMCGFFFEERTFTIKSVRFQCFFINIFANSLLTFPHCSHNSANVFRLKKTFIFENRTPETNLTRTRKNKQERENDWRKKTIWAEAITGFS